MGHTKLENLHSPYYASFTFSKANKALHLVEHCHLSRLLGMLFYKPRDFIGVLGLNKPLVWRAAVVLSMSMKNRRASEKQLARAEVRRKPKNRHRNRGFAAEEIDNLSDALFKEMFRINREAFEYIETLLDARIVRDAQKAKNSSGSVISSRTRLAVTLRWLAGGSHIDLCFAWGVSKSAFYSTLGVLWPTIEAINDILEDIGFPIDNLFELEEMRKGFNTKNNGIMDGLVMVIGGLIVRTRAPYKCEVNDPKSYAHRKCGFGILVMAGCDVHAKFRSVTAKNTGSTNDNVAWDASALADALSKGNLPPRYFIGGDEAFSCSEYLLSPWHGRGIGKWKDSFNYWLSHSRQTIERAFGMLTMRWGIYWRKFRFSYDRWSLVIELTMKLHNLCVDRGLKVPLRRYYEDHEIGDRNIVYDNERADDRDFYRRTRVDRRTRLTTALEDSGTGRPQHAWENSRSA